MPITADLVKSMDEHRSQAEKCRAEAQRHENEARRIEDQIKAEASDGTLYQVAADEVLTVRGATIQRIKLVPLPGGTDAP